MLRGCVLLGFCALGVADPLDFVDTVLPVLGCTAFRGTSDARPPEMSAVVLESGRHLIATSDKVKGILPRTLAIASMDESEWRGLTNRRALPSSIAIQRTN